MIKTWKHKGLKEFFINGSTRGIQVEHKKKIAYRLYFLDTAQCIDDLNIPGFNLHKLRGDKRNLWSIKVSGNWRITFEFVEGNVYIVNYEDYH